MRKIPLKNYVVLGVILFVSIMVVVYVNGWLKQTKKQYTDNMVIFDFIKEIKVSEIDNYVIENPNFIIYISSKSNRDNIKFENDLEKFLADNDLQKDFIFINMDDFSNDSYSDFINKYYNNEEKFVLTDSIIVVDEQKIKSIFNSQSNQLSIKNVKKFLKNNEVY